MRVLMIPSVTAAIALFAAVAQPPELFAPHLWSPGEEVHGGTFTGDGDSFYFFKKVQPGQEDFRIVVSHRRGGVWSAPVRVPFSDSTSDLYPAVSADGRRIVFTSYRPTPDGASARRNAHLWMTELRGGAWSEPVFLSGISTIGAYHAGVKMLADGTVFFRVITATDRGMFRASLVDGGYPRRERVEAFDALQSDSVRVWGAEPSPDGRRFFLTLARPAQAPGTFGPSDIHVVRASGGQWSAPEPLSSEVNSSASEGAVTMTPDMRFLIFSRDGRLYQIAVREPPRQ